MDAVRKRLDCDDRLRVRNLYIFTFLHGRFRDQSNKFQRISQGTLSYNRNSGIRLIWTLFPHEDLREFIVQTLVGRENTVRAQLITATMEVRYKSAGFTNQENARGNVPLVEAVFPEAVIASGCHIGEVQSGGSCLIGRTKNFGSRNSASCTSQSTNERTPRSNHDVERCP